MKEYGNKAAQQVASFGFKFSSVNTQKKKNLPLW